MSEMVKSKPALSSHDLVVRLCASGIMIALSTVLSLITIIKMPMGGSLTPVSMLPVCMIAIIYGTKWGLCTSFAYALVQLILDFAAALSWGLSVPALVACFVFDYLLAFTIFLKLKVKVANAQVKFIGLFSTAVSFVTFLMNGQVAIGIGIYAIICNMIGSYIGAGMVMKNGMKVAKPSIILVLVLLAVKFVTDQF